MNQYHVVLEVKPQYQRPERSTTIYVGAPARAQVPLSAIAKRPDARRRSSVNHQGQFPSVTLSFNLAPGNALGQAVDAIHAAESEDRPARERARQLLGHGAGLQRVARERAAPRRVRARAPSTSCSASSTRAGSTPSRSSRRCPRRASARCSRCSSSRRDFSIIALIGIILLIGIVKKNAIMMIDFAIEAERERRPLTRWTPSTRRACCASGRS